MSNRYDLYGSRRLEPDELERLVAERLGIELSAHDSSAWGPYALWSGPGRQNVRVTTNYVDEDGYLLEQDHSEYRSFVYVNANSDPESVDERLRTIDGLEHLRTERVET